MRATSAAVLASLAVLLALLGSGSTRAQAYESFTLEEDDKLIAEGAGCHAECKAVGPRKRVCTIKDASCKAVCQAVPECKTDGAHVLQVCAVMRTGI